MPVMVWQTYNSFLINILIQKNKSTNKKNTAFIHIYKQYTRRYMYIHTKHNNRRLKKKIITPEITNRIKALYIIVIYYITH